LLEQVREVAEVKSEVKAVKDEFIDFENAI
jgi:hypothetical protein